MIKVNFVCHGNICRSPMAEFILKKMAKDNKYCHGKQNLLLSYCLSPYQLYYCSRILKGYDEYTILSINYLYLNV